MTKPTDNTIEIDNFDPRWFTALETMKNSVPTGFAVRAMQKILLEKIRRAEVEAMRRSMLFAILMVTLTVLVVLLLNLLGWSSAEWLNQIPWPKILPVVLGILGLQLLDAMCQREIRPDL